MHVHAEAHQPGHGGQPPGDGQVEQGAQDHNLRAAYLHVLADALTSVLAIAALVAGKLFGWIWLDPAIGVLGSLLIARWAYGLAGDTARILLDYDSPSGLSPLVREVLEEDGHSRVEDLHVWEVGSNAHAMIASIVSTGDAVLIDYKQRLERFPSLRHVTIELRAVTAVTPKGEPPVASPGMLS